MSKIDEYKAKLLKLNHWEEFLIRNSNLPSPRSNLELLAAAVEAGTKDKFIKFLEFTVEVAPVNNPGEFICAIGVAGLGKLITEGDSVEDYFNKLIFFSADPRWRIREGVAMALQYIGRKDMTFLLASIQKWAQSTLFVQRALVAGLCEPVLLKNPEHASQVLNILFKITTQLNNQSLDKKAESYRVLKKALSYGWSVAIVALPQTGKEYFELLMKNGNADIGSIVKENLGKNRLVKMDKEWVNRMLKQF